MKSLGTFQDKVTKKKVLAWIFTKLETDSTDNEVITIPTDRELFNEIQASDSGVWDRLEFGKRFTSINL